MAIIIIKRDGQPTSPPMEQTQAENYLTPLIEKNRWANLKQAMNNVTTSGRGTPTEPYKYKGKAVLHASSGIADTKTKKVSLFYYEEGGNQYIVAMGKHVGPIEYELSDYGQPDGDFKENRKIKLGS